jgi:hypothetical protein
VLPKITKDHAIRQIMLDECSGGMGQKDLPAVPRRSDPGRPIYVDSNVVGPADIELAHACVQTHPDPKDNASGPVMAGQCSLPGSRCVKRLLRSQKDGEERVSLGSNLNAVARSNGSAQDLSMVILHLPVALVTELL